jgi:hypothetical protein
MWSRAFSCKKWCMQGGHGESWLNGVWSKHICTVECYVKIESVVRTQHTFLLNFVMIVKAMCLHKTIIFGVKQWHETR